MDFAYLADASVWFALSHKGAITIVLRGQNLDVRSVELVPVEDVGPYIEGTRRL